VGPLLSKAVLALAAILFAVKQRTVTLDVKDEDIRLILKDMQTQCAIRNLVIDPDVEGKGTFVFRGVPCPTAFDVVTRTMGLRVDGQQSPECRVSAGERVAAIRWMTDDLKALLDTMRLENAAAHAETLGRFQLVEEVVAQLCEAEAETRRHFDVSMENSERKLQLVAEVVSHNSAIV
jgi:hypothetical protein